jgi:hypothetical protein
VATKIYTVSNQNLNLNFIFQSIITLHQLHKLIFVEISISILNSVHQGEFSDFVEMFTMLGSPTALANLFSNSVFRQIWNEGGLLIKDLEEERKEEYPRSKIS